MIAQAIAAKGGLDRLQRIQTLRAEATTRVTDRQATGTISTVTLIQYPDRYRVEADADGRRIVQVYADGRYWIQDAQGAREAPVSVRDEIHASIQRDVVPLLLRAAAGKLTLRDVHSDDGSLAAVAVGGDGMMPVTLFVNRASGLIVREQYAAPDGAGVIQERYSDYRDVNGVQVAFQTVVERPGAPLIERDVENIRFNIPLQASLFVRPS